VPAPLQKSGIQTLETTPPLEAVAKESLERTSYRLSDNGEKADEHDAQSQRLVLANVKGVTGLIVLAVLFQMPSVKLKGRVYIGGHNVMKRRDRNCMSSRAQGTGARI
jgi:hypothetical protein